MVSHSLVSVEIENVFDRSVVLDHFLVVSSALLWGSGGDDEGHVEEHLLGFSTEFVLQGVLIFAEKLEIKGLLVGIPPSPFYF